MKFNLIKVSVLTVATLLAGCAAVPVAPVVDVTPVWAPAHTAVDGSVNPQLRDLLKQGTTPKVVLRVPNIASSIVQSDTSKNSNYDALYGRIEKRLVSEGFIVRDRALLQSLMSSGMSDYASIGKRIDTDLIIEISKISFNESFQRASQFLDTNKQAVSFDGRYLTNSVAVIDVRVIQVKTGNVAAIITLKTGARELGEHAEYFKVNRGLTFLGNRAFGNPATGDLPGVYYAPGAPRDRIDTNFLYYLGGYTFTSGEEGGYALGRNRVDPSNPFTFFYIQTSEEKAVDKLAKLLIDRLRGDI